MTTETGSIPADGEGEVTLAPGTRLGKYEIVRLLGSGGMGAVYEATHLEIGKRVAIKVLSPTVAAVRGARARFLREAQLTSRVRHPHIVDVTDMGTEGSHTFLVMELLRGEDLADRLARIGRLSIAELVDIMLPVCSAVGAAHAASITHRDLKPQNIFLATGPHSMQPKVLDFGISKGDDDMSSAALTGTGAMIGTPFYLAPEQIMDNRSAGPASDQYALGVILYECLTGVRPFVGDNLYALFQRIVAGTAPTAREHNPELPREMEQIISRAMAVNPASRFGSVEDLGRALLPFASQRTRTVWQDAFATASSHPGARVPTTPLPPPTPGLGLGVVNVTLPPTNFPHGAPITSSTSLRPRGYGRFIVMGGLVIGATVAAAMMVGGRDRDRTGDDLGDRDRPPGRSLDRTAARDEIRRPLEIPEVPPPPPANPTPAVVEEPGPFPQKPEQRVNRPGDMADATGGGDDSRSRVRPTPVRPPPPSAGNRRRRPGTGSGNATIATPPPPPPPSGGRATEPSRLPNPNGAPVLD